MALLDDLSGYEFEDLMVDVFRHRGYENVSQSARTADEGRDILMEEVVDGRRRVVVVECKHTDTVSRPVVQKLHSAVATYDYDGPKRGMVATTGRFTGPAREYARELGTTTDGGVELVDGTDLREIGEEIGMDLYNGRIEILCDEALAPFPPSTGPAAPVFDVVREIENIDPTTIPTPETSVTFQPMIAISASTSATFETSVGVIHSLNDTTDLVLHAAGDEPRVARSERSALVTNRTAPRIDLEDRRAELDATVAAVERERFGRTETAYKEWAIDRLRQAHTTTVHYTGDNNVDYEKTCSPSRSDVSIRSIDPIYLPRVHSRVELGEYAYRYAFDAAGSARSTTRNDFRECVHCGADDGDATYTYCANCGSINCDDHIETERVENAPVCTGCAVTERFALRRKYFYDAENRAAFREEYAAMPVHEKAMENVPLAVGSVLALSVTCIVIASSVGVL